MRKIMLAGSLAMVLGLSGCASSGTKIDQDVVAQIQPGQTTKQELITNLGAPLTQSYDSDGNLTMIWHYVHVGPFGMNSKQQNLAVVFNDDGTVSKYNMIDGANPGARIGY